MATHKDIAIILSRYQAAFPNYNPSDITLAAEVWTEALGHIPADELKVAALACMVETGRAFAPSVGEVLGAVMRLRAQASGLPSAAEAWEQINKPRDLTRWVICEVGDKLRQKCNDWKTTAEYMAAIADYSRHADTCDDCKLVEPEPVVHPAVERVARQFGWPDRFPGDNPEADRAHFMRAYDAEVKRETERQAQPAQVQKYIEAQSVTGAVAALAEGMRK